MKKVTIKRPSKTNMQSGLKKTKLWIIEFEFDPSLQKDVLMGWNSSKNTTKQLKLNFDNCKDAINAGANYLVMGRPITKSSNPLKSLQSINTSLE